MRWLQRLFRRGARAEADLEAEVRFHLDEEARLHADRGESPGEAASVARQLFGNVTVVKETTRRMWGWARLRSMLDDLRYVIRSFARAKGLAAAAVLTFALGVGANIAVFSMFDRMLFRPLPYAEPDRLVHLHSSLAIHGPFAAVLPFNVTRALAAEDDLFSGVAWAEGGARETVPRSGETPLLLTSVTSTALDVLGLKPMIGRGFSEPDISAMSEVLLTHETWQRRYSGSTDVLSLAWSDDRTRYQVVGVLPPGFLLPTSRLAAERYDGLTGFAVDFSRELHPGHQRVAPFARLQPGVSIEAARARVDALIATRFERTSWFNGVTILPLQSGISVMVRPYLWLVIGAAWAVLGVTCFSLAMLLLTWGQSRRHDAGVRLALGASPGRLVGAALWESVIVCGIGSCIGWLGYLWARAVLIGVVPPILRPFAVEPTDIRVVMATIGTALLGAVIAGTLPAFAAVRADVLSVLHPERDTSRPRSLRGRSALLAVQAAFGLVLVVGASATVPGFLALLLNSPGFEPSGLFVVEVPHNWPDDRIPSGAHDETHESLSTPDGASRVRTVLETLGKLPGALDVAATVTQPFTTGSAVDGHFWKEHGISGHDWAVSAGFFQTLGAPMRAGRSFTDEEIADKSLVAILNEAGVRALWPETNPDQALGRIVLTTDGSRIVIGIARDFRSHPDVPVAPSLFIPITASEVPPRQNRLSVLLRMAPGRTPDAALVNAGLNAQFPRNTARVQSVSAALAPALEQPRFLAVLFGSLAAITLFLIAVGLYGLVGFEVVQRQREMGIRLALGATMVNLRGRVVRVIALPVLLGITVGLSVAWWGGRLLGASVAHVDADRVHVYVVGALTTLLVALIAAWLPARRLGSMRPADVLRSS